MGLLLAAENRRDTWISECKRALHHLVVLHERKPHLLPERWEAMGRSTEAPHWPPAPASTYPFNAPRCDQGPCSATDHPTHAAHEWIQVKQAVPPSHAKESWETTTVVALGDTRGMICYVAICNWCETRTGKEEKPRQTNGFASHWCPAFSVLEMAWICQECFQNFQVEALSYWGLRPVMIWIIYLQLIILFRVYDNHLTSTCIKPGSVLVRWGCISLSVFFTVNESFLFLFLLFKK